jgi:flavin-dependent dehydrogenase
MNAPITIVGGGLSGLSLSIALRTCGVPVVLFEKRRYPFHRVCGEFISGVSERVLRELGIADCLGDAVRIEQMSWWIGDRLVLDQALPRFARGISRFTLDARLADRARACGVDLREGRLYDGGDQEGIVWASGKSVRSGSSWIGLSAHFEGIETNRLEMHCGSRGYLGMSPIENGQVNVTGLFRKDATIKGRGTDLLVAYLKANRCHKFVQRLEAGQVIMGSFTAIAGFEFGSQSRSGFSIGDQSLLIPPFAGNGMSMALEAAAYASNGLEAFRKGELTWRDVCRSQAEFEKRAFGVRMKVASRLHPFLLSPIGLPVLGRLSAFGMLPAKRLFNALR